MQKQYNFRISLFAFLALSVGFVKAQTPVILGPVGTLVASTVLSEYSGNFGIGIPQPTVKLDVSGAGKFTSALEAQKLKLTDGEIAGSGTLYLSPTGSGSIKMTIAANANVGIGQSNTFSSAANNLIVGTTNVLSSAASHHLVVGVSNESSGLYGLTHGTGNVITSGVLAGFNYAMGKDNTISFNQSIALDGFNYALGTENEITSDSKTGLNYTIGGINKINFKGFGSDAAGINFVVGANNEVNVDLSASNDEHEIGVNHINGISNKILGESIGCFQSGIMLETNNALGAFTIGAGDFLNGNPLINNNPLSLMVGFGTQPTFFVKDNHVGINTTSIGDAALRITSRDTTGGTKLDIKAVGDVGWQNQIRFMDNAGNFRHMIIDDLDSNFLVIAPGYWNGGNPVATNTLKVDGRVKIGNVKTPSSPTSDYMLYVEKGILTERLKCAVKTTNDWSDFVFDENYKLQSLEDVADFIKCNKHLPDVPSAQEMVENGLDVTQMNALLLRKIEELTLHVISLEQKIKIYEK